MISGASIAENGLKAFFRQSKDSRHPESATYPNPLPYFSKLLVITKPISS